MSEYTWQAVSLIGRLLWDHGLWVLLGTMFWGALFAAVGIALAVATWFVVGRRGWLDYGLSWDRWQRIAVLVVWIIGGAGLLGTAGLFLGAERAAIDVIEKERVATLACRGAAEAIAIPLIREANRRSELALDAAVLDQRTAVGDLRALRERGWDVLDAVERELLAQQVAADDDVELTARAKLLVARWAIDRAHTELLGDGDQRLVGYLDRLETLARADGTVGVEDFAAVLGAEVLEPAVHTGVSSIFGSFRTPLYLWFVALLAAPLLLAAAIRWARRRAASSART